MNFNKFFFLLFIISLLIFTCGKDDEPPVNCECGELPNADFTISQGIGFNEDRRYFESDTILKGPVKVESVNQLLSYEWKIGTDPTIRTGKSVELDYDVLGEIEVTLIGHWTPDKDCFPNDNGVDTVMKKFYLVPRLDAKYFGDFEGYYESEPDSLVTIYINNLSRIHNIPIGCFENDLAAWGTYRHFFMRKYDAKNPCPIPKGWGTISDDNQTLTLDYEIWDLDLSERVKRKFIGTRK